MESASGVELPYVLTERDLDASDSSVLHVLDCALYQSHSYVRSLGSGVYHQVEKERIGYTVTENGHVSNEGTVLCSNGVIRVMPIKD